MKTSREQATSDPDQLTKAPDPGELRFSQEASRPDDGLEPDGSLHLDDGLDDLWTRQAAKAGAVAGPESGRVFWKDPIWKRGPLASITNRSADKDAAPGASGPNAPAPRPRAAKPPARPKEGRRRRVEQVASASPPAATSADLGLRKSREGAEPLSTIASLRKVAAASAKSPTKSAPVGRLAPSVVAPAKPASAKTAASAETAAPANTAVAEASAGGADGNGAGLRRPPSLFFSGDQTGTTLISSGFDEPAPTGQTQSVSVSVPRIARTSERRGRSNRAAGVLGSSRVRRTALAIGATATVLLAAVLVLSPRDDRLATTAASDGLVTAAEAGAGSSPTPDPFNLRGSRSGATDEPASTSDSPSTDSPSTDSPSTDSPSTDSPSTDSPSTDSPSTDSTADESSSTTGESTSSSELSTTGSSTTGPSTTEPSTTGSSTTESSTSSTESTTSTTDPTTSESTTTTTEATTSTSAATTSTAAQGACTSPNWIPVLDEQFNGSSVDGSRWSPYDSTGNAGHGLRRPSALSVSGGILTITAQMEGGTIVSGGMKHRHTQMYGRYEVRVKTEVDPSNATSGVVLTWPGSNVHPRDGENNIYETLWDPGTRREFYTFIHKPYGSTSDQDYTVHGVSAADWHTMVMEWTPDWMKIYRDGTLIKTITETSADLLPDNPHFFAIQFDAWENSISSPVRMQVDYAKVWRLEGC